MGSIGSNNGNSKKADEKFVEVVVIVDMRRSCVVVESCEPFAWLELGSLLFDLLLWTKERGSVSDVACKGQSSNLSLLQTNGMFSEIYGISVTHTGALSMEGTSCKNEPIFREYLHVYLH